MRTHMSPAQAAQVAGVSRWAVMRAIKAQRLKAFRDNRNRWMIASRDLADWCAAHGAHIVRDSAGAQVETVIEWREKLATAIARAEAAERARDQAEAERDRWRNLAETLAARPRGWWPFRR